MRISLTPTRHLVIGLARARRLEFWDLRRRVVVVQCPCVVSSPRLVDSKCIEANGSLIANAQQIPNISRLTDSLLLVCPWPLIPNISGRIYIYIYIDLQYLQGCSLPYPQAHSWFVRTPWWEIYPGSLIPTFLWPTLGYQTQSFCLLAPWRGYN